MSENVKHSFLRAQSDVLNTASFDQQRKEVNVHIDEDGCLLFFF